MSRAEGTRFLPQPVGTGTYKIITALDSVWLWEAKLDGTKVKAVLVHQCWMQMWLSVVLLAGEHGAFVRARWGCHLSTCVETSKVGWMCQTMHCQCLSRSSRMVSATAGGIRVEQTSRCRNLQESIGTRVTGVGE